MSLLWTLLALKKGENGKRVEEKMLGPGEMVVGRMAPRSIARDLLEPSNKARQDLMSSPEYKMFEKWAKKFKKHYRTADEKIERFKIWRSKKECFDAEYEKRGGLKYGLDFFSDLTPCESSQYFGRKNAFDPYKGYMRTPEFYDSKYGKEVAEEEAAFDKWVAQHRKNYGSRREREDKFAAYFQNKKMIDTIRKENPGCYLVYPHELDIKMDQAFSRIMLKNLLNGSAPGNEGCSAPSNHGCSSASN